VLTALTNSPTPSLERGERSYVGRDPIDMTVARAQHAAYCNVLRECGADVTTLNVNRDHPDAVFIEDTAVVFDELAVMMRPGAASRADEPREVEPYLATYRRLARIESPGTIDGGDVVVNGRHVYVGASARSNTDGVAQLATHLAPFGYAVSHIGLRDCLHLKSACCALPDGRLLIHPGWVDTDALSHCELVAIPAEEPFGADFATAGNTVIVSESNPRTAALISNLGFGVRTTPLSEFEKAEGGVSCLSLIFRR
jgi:dimethylargininase